MYDFTEEDTNLDSQALDLGVAPSSEDTATVEASTVQDSTAHLPPPTSISKER